MVVRIKSRWSIACSASQRLCAHTWRQDVPILPVALSFPPKRMYQSNLQFISICGTPSAPPMPTSRKASRTRINTLQIAVASRILGTAGAMTATSRSVLDVVESEGNGGGADDEGRRDGRTGSEPRGTFFAGKRSGDRDAHGRLSPKVELSRLESPWASFLPLAYRLGAMLNNFRTQRDRSFIQMSLDSPEVLSCTTTVASCKDR